MKCQECGQESRAGARFCEQCGVAVPSRCPACREVVASTAKFCHRCGAAISRGDADATQGGKPIPSAPVDATTSSAGLGDRRHAVVLFADIVGYTAMCAGSDAEPIQLVLGSFFEAMDAVVEAHGGRVFDRAGDAVMAVFGAPVAHGNDAQRALRAALAMHQAAGSIVDAAGAPLRLHVGLASGEVVAAVIGGGTSKYSVTGSAVNLGARLAALASPGETLISDSLHRQTLDTIETESTGELTVKGFAAPQPTWRLRGLRQGPGERRPFVGRRAELRQLVGALQAVQEGGAGATLLVRGEAGIGKSRLVDEFAARVRDQGFATAVGQVLDFGVGKGQDVVATLSRSLLGLDPLDDDAKRRAALRSAVAQGRVADDEVLFANEWLGLPQPTDLALTYAAMDDDTRRRRAGEALANLAARCAAVQPLWILVEDVHWAPPELLRHLAALSRVSSQAPILLLLTTRIEGDPIDKAWRASIHGSPLATIDLSPLRLREALQLASSMVETSSRFAQRCIERAEGNPLFLEQLLRKARDDETPDLETALPPTIQGLVLERMDRLAPHERSLLQVAAVLGKRFSLLDLSALSEEAESGCRVLVAADMVRRDGADYLFAHALIQEAVYESTLKARRRELHRAAARWFSGTDLVLHAEHLDRAGDEAAAAAYLDAARGEASRHRFEAALRLAERGLALARAAAPRAEPAVTCALGLLLGDVLREVGRSAESVTSLQAALALTDDEQQRCDAWMGIAAGYRVTGDFEAAMAALANAQPIAERLELGAQRSRIHHTRGNLYFAQGRVDECDEEHAAALKLADICGDAESQARALSGLGDARYARGQMRAALDHFQRCVALSSGQIRIDGPNRCMIGHCLWYENRLPEAIDVARSARDDALRGGVVPVQVFAEATLAQLLTEAGRDEEADASGAEALELARRAGSRRYEATMLMFAADRRLRRGDRVRAKDDLAAALALARQTGLGFIGAALHGRMARVATDAEERSRCLAEGQALLGQTGLAHNHLWFYRDAIEARLASCEWAQALAQADAIERLFAVETLPWVDFVVERARAIAEAAKTPGHAAASQRLAAARAVAEAAEMRWALPGIDAALAAPRQA